MKSAKTTDAADWIKRARTRIEQLGLSQTTLAEMIGVLPARVNHYLTGRNEPTIAHLMLICRALQVSSDWLLFGGASAPLLPVRQVDPLADKLASLSGTARRDIEGYLRVTSKVG